MGEVQPDPTIPSYGGPCISGLGPALWDRADTGVPSWLPSSLNDVSQVVLLVMDGLGWQQLMAKGSIAPTLSTMAVGPMASVAPTTTATALTSITTGRTPADHGVLGYRVAVGPGNVMNVLRWSTPAGDARATIAPASFQPRPAFGGRDVPVVTKAEFAGTGFSNAHLMGGRLFGWRMPSTLRTRIREMLSLGESFVYAYYDGIDKVAHEFGCASPYYEAELAFADALVADILSDLPKGAALVITSDHGQVDVGDAVLALDPEVLENDVSFLSGEGRFRWLHVASGARLDALAGRLVEAYGDVAWVRTRQEMVEESWFGGEIAASVASRLGDVALVAYEPVAFADPADTGELRLISRHGSLTQAEVLVPLGVAEA